MPVDETVLMNSRIDGYVDLYVVRPGPDGFTPVSVDITRLVAKALSQEQGGVAGRVPSDDGIFIGDLPATSAADATEDYKRYQRRDCLKTWLESKVWPGGEAYGRFTFQSAEDIAPDPEDTTRPKLKPETAFALSTGAILVQTDDGGTAVIPPVNRDELDERASTESE